MSGERCYHRPYSPSAPDCRAVIQVGTHTAKKCRTYRVDIEREENWHTRLHQTLRATDVVARLGDDEFVLLLQGLGSTQEQAAQHAHILCNKLQMVLAQPYQLGTVTYQASASIGLSLLEPRMPSTLDDLLREADTRMYAQKKTMSPQTACV